MKPISRRGAVLATTVAILVAALLASDGAASAVDQPSPDQGHHHLPRRPIVKKRRIAPGLTFTRIIDKRTPLRTYVLRMDPSKAVTLDVALAANTLPGRRPIPEIAKANDALAAVNGDFGNPRIGRPTHPFLMDGELVQTAVQRGPLFALSQDGQHVYLGKPDIDVSLTDTQSNRSWRIARWNQGPPAPGEIVGFSPVGGTLEEPPRYACSVRLQPSGPTRFDADETSLIGDYVVDTSACDKASMDRQGGVVLSALPSTDEATELLAMTPGTSMRLRWSLGWAGVLDAIGGMPVLVQDGAIVAPTCSTAFCRANPRTGIGYTEHGGIILVVVDGRQPRWSIGATLGQFAEIMRKFGAVQAMNLDGGGSTTMVVQGKVVNEPSDGHARSLTNAVLVLPGPDPGES